jgi:hypothetical protein
MIPWVDATELQIRDRLNRLIMETVAVRTSTRPRAGSEQRLLGDRPGPEVARELDMTPNVV